jgi:hypothetical protein
MNSCSWPMLRNDLSIARKERQGFGERISLVESGR